MDQPAKRSAPACRHAPMLLIVNPPSTSIQIFKLFPSTPIKIQVFENLDHYYITPIYQNNIYNGHLNILDIIENKDSGENLNEIIINYNNLTKDIYNDWYKNKFEPTKDNLETNISKIENSLVKIRRTFINIINNLIIKSDDVLNKKMCPICFENEIDMCSIPCGHTCCNKCIISSRSNYNNNKRCLSCRNEINDNIKIYFLI